MGVYLSDSNPLQVISNVTGQSVQNAGLYTCKGCLPAQISIIFLNNNCSLS